ncbi:response regulator [soil metagenome]
MIFVDGQEALDYLDLNFKESDYYLVLLDINMPVMDGWEFLKIVSDKVYAQHVFFAMVTSSVDRADKEKAIAYSQVIDFVEKPISFEECKKIRLMSQIAEHMDS